MTSAAEKGTNLKARHDNTRTGTGFSTPLHPALGEPLTELRWPGLATAKRAVTIFVLSGCVLLPAAQAGPAPQVPAAEPPAPPASAPLSAENAPTLTVTYVDGQLNIKALNTTLAEVLSKVASLTGVKFDVPPAAGAERLPFVEAGPGTAREVLAEMLSDTNFDYLLAASETDPDRIQSVLLMPREKKGARSNRMDPASRQARSYNRPEPTQPDMGQLSDNSAQPATVETAPPGASIPTPPPPPQPSGRGPQLYGLEPGQSNVPPTSPVPLPSNMDTPSINQQLQQMYQQRQQMNQVARPSTQSGPGND